MPSTQHPAPLYRYILAWALMVGGLAGFWCCRPWLGTRTFNIGQALVLGRLVEGGLAALPAARGVGSVHSLEVSGLLRLVGDAADAIPQGSADHARGPVPTVRGFLLNMATGAALLWLVPRLLPAATPFPVRFWIGLVGICFLSLIARFDFYALIFRAMGFAVEKLWDCPIAATSLGDFWGRRWNRLVSGLLREVIFYPVARRAGARAALLAVFLYSGFYHELLSFMAGDGYGRPALYFLLQYLGVAAENTRPARRLLRSQPWLGRTWTAAVVILPVGLFLHPRSSTATSCRCWCWPECRDSNARRLGWDMAKGDQRSET